MPLLCKLNQFGSSDYTLVNYTQLEDGDYPAGTMWNKSEHGFRAHFTVVETPAGRTQPADSLPEGARRTGINVGDIRTY